ncbi:MAG: CCA tRNA nucleotidyltransferase [Myxococcaceae bacterium]
MSLPEPLANAVIPEPVLKVCARLTERGYRAFLVGGCVRDILRGLPPKDWDVATSAMPKDVQLSFDKVIPTGIQHGTVTVVTKGAQVEVTTFRTEGEYVDGRRPSSVEFRTEIADDLSRRDFTINAMAFDPVKKELVDPFGGQADLHKKLIRAVGTAHDRFSEDGLRALRAVRFAAVLGFSIDEETKRAIPRTIPVFKKISVERIREEFQKLLLSDRAYLGLELLDQTGLLSVFLPELHELRGFTHGLPMDHFELAARSVEQLSANLDQRLAALLAEIARPRTLVATPEGASFPDHDRLGAELTREILTRLKFPNKVIDKVVLLVREHAAAVGGSWNDGQVRRFVARVGVANLEDLFAVMEAQRRALGDETRLSQLRAFRDRVNALLREKPALDAKSLALNGGDLMRALNVGPSPIVGEATRFLMDLVFDNPAQNTREKLTEALRKWAENRGL